MFFFNIIISIKLFSLAHGTFLGTIRLEPHKPIQLPTDESFSFGASTRTWTLREKPPNASILDTQSLNTSETSENETSNISLLGLPEAENDLNVSICIARKIKFSIKDFQCKEAFNGKIRFLYSDVAGNNILWFSDIFGWYSNGT